jgi:pSer/pThr/pTyr-binding forkhead associated (FHA) protein
LKRRDSATFFDLEVLFSQAKMNGAIITVFASFLAEKAMPENKAATVRRETFFEKLIRRVLETVGSSVDRLFGREKKQPDALPSTADLAERLRRMIDAQARINKDGRKLAPHLIQIKYAWGSTSDDFQRALKRLENELLIIAAEHINDNRFATLAPLKAQSRADVLTENLTLAIGFDDETLKNSEQVEVPVEIYAKLRADHNPAPPEKVFEIEVAADAIFLSGARRRTILRFTPGKRDYLTVGRIKENDLYLDDMSVSKHHASLVMSADGVLKVADTGSSNGTAIDGIRIAYGKAFEIKPENKVSFGDVQVSFAWEVKQPEPKTAPPSSSEILESTNQAPKNVFADADFRIGIKTNPREDLQEFPAETHDVVAKDFTQDLKTQPLDSSFVENLAINADENSDENSKDKISQA